MKTTKSGLILAVLIAMISASSCSVEYRTRHPRPPRTKKVIVVGKTDTNENINDNGLVEKSDETSVAAY